MSFTRVLQYTTDILTVTLAAAVLVRVREIKMGSALAPNTRDTSHYLTDKRRRIKVHTIKIVDRATLIVNVCISVLFDVISVVPG